MTPPRTLIVGAGGLIGRHLLAAYRELDPETPGTARTSTGPGVFPLDLASLAPSPLRGEGRGGGERSHQGEGSTPHPDPPPQGGRERESAGSLLLPPPGRGEGRGGGRLRAEPSTPHPHPPPQGGRGLEWLDGIREAIIAAAVPRVDDCERDPVGSSRVNVAGTLELARRLSGRGIVPVFLSSDYVFAGTDPAGYADDSETNPTTEYGRQKAEVEAALAASGRPFTVLRLSKVFGLTRGDGTLLDEMAAKLTAGGIVSAATDQVFCPAWVGDVVRAAIAVQRAGLRGVVNLVPAEAWSRYDLAVELAKAVGARESQVRPISLDDLPGVRRPKCTKLIPTPAVPFAFTPVRECIRRLAQEYAGE